MWPRQVASSASSSVSSSQIFMMNDWGSEPSMGLRHSFRGNTSLGGKDIAIAARLAGLSERKYNSELTRIASRTRLSERLFLQRWTENQTPSGLCRKAFGFLSINRHTWTFSMAYAVPQPTR